MFTPLHNRITRPLLYQSVVERILELAATGQVAPGESFPTERELVEEWQISRNVLREAFHILGERGIVFSIQGKGRFLRKLPSKAMGQKSVVMAMEKKSLTEIYETRRALELFAIDLAVARASVAELAAFRKKFEEIKRQFLRTRSVDREFELHLGYAALSGNYLLEEMVATTLRLVAEFMSTTFSRVKLKHSVDDYIHDHGHILSCLEQRRADEAKETLIEHFARTTTWIADFRGKGQRLWDDAQGS